MIHSSGYESPPDDSALMQRAADHLLNAGFDEFYATVRADQQIVDMIYDLLAEIAQRGPEAPVISVLCTGLYDRLRELSLQHADGIAQSYREADAQ